MKTAGTATAGTTTAGTTAASRPAAVLRVCTIVALLAAEVGLVLLLVTPHLDPARIRPLPIVAGAWLVFLTAAWLLRGTAKRLAVPLILLGGIGVQLAALSAPPATSSDLYRYIWDGHVQAAGIDPYAYAPADRGVAQLRDPFLWSATKNSGTGPGFNYYDCVHTFRNRQYPLLSLETGCTKINRMRVPTIYPPVAEAYFWGVQAAVPGADTSTTPIQAAAAACALATTVILLFGLRVLGKDVRLAALWAWCPTVALEAGNNAHVDVLAVAITALALLVLARARTEGRTMLGGALLGLAIATKMTPVLVVPAVLRRRWFVVAASAATAMSMVYAPHVLAVGRKVIGFLPGYLKQEGYTNGRRFLILDLLFQHKVATGIAVVTLGVVAYFVLRLSNPDQPWHGAVVMTAAALAVTTPVYQWYSLLLVMLVALDGRPEWLGLAASSYMAADPVLGKWTPPHAGAVGYGAGLLIAIAGSVVRYRLARRQGLATPVLPALESTALAATIRGDYAVTLTKLASAQALAEANGSPDPVGHEHLAFAAADQNS
jgi:Glycosyltransferase family 87